MTITQDFILFLFGLLIGVILGWTYMRLLQKRLQKETIKKWKEQRIKSNEEALYPYH